jgi:hypothetical protein
MRYAPSLPMKGLVACPFCREMFEASEARSCPECGLTLQDIGRLPPAHDDEEEPVPPHMETLPWTYMGRGRGPLIVVAALGLLAFFLPWVNETVPDLRQLSGLDLARRLSWMWAPAAAFFVMLPLVLTRRSVYAMRGARLAVALLAVAALATVILRLVLVPEGTRLRPLQFSWGYGLYATGALALLSLVISARFGGRIEDLPTQAKRRGDETLH